MHPIGPTTEPTNRVVLARRTPFHFRTCWSRFRVVTNRAVVYWLCM